MLRVVMALKRDPDLVLEDVVQRVIAETGVEADGFRVFVGRHATVIVSALEQRPEGEL